MTSARDEVMTELVEMYRDARVDPLCGDPLFALMDKGIPSDIASEAERRVRDAECGTPESWWQRMHSAAGDDAIDKAIRGRRA
ncbi:hypothetical protein [Aurantimonas endophytica]|uniref:Uncharacterized protein n=1 Tax=Aurantimonas endophytica TaxID=1522175 RepID=A0A7W6HDH8_9HYPH|nr:hypothetical protein [Aurantimonas endophytica]MBB4003235.1 hypothetical protein [Aurantimonas endophytica]MCO6404097.1 hypothetical protein [Aurantimonas endophytica]